MIPIQLCLPQKALDTAFVEYDEDFTLFVKPAIFVGKYIVHSSRFHSKFSKNTYFGSKNFKQSFSQSRESYK